MIPVVEVGGARVFLGDCREVLGQLPDNSVDSIVTDPPYELGFMGKKWDSSGVAYDVNVWMDCLRVLKPGGHLLAFGGSRTWHRLAVAVEDAGFELRDSIAWLYGSGFPKSLDVSKAIEAKIVTGGSSPKNLRKTLMAENYEPHRLAGSEGFGVSRGGGFGADESRDSSADKMPTSPEAKAWEGWGTALKPAFEPVVVGRKPLVGTVAENVLAWGVGGLNIDGSRIAGGERPLILSSNEKSTNAFGDGLNGSKHGGTFTQGRWPANVILDEVTAGLLDEQSGNAGGGFGVRGKGGQTYANGKGFANTLQETGQTVGYGDSGGASRFFYVAKASKRDRNEGLEDLEATSAGDMVDREEGSAGMNSLRAGAGRTSGAKNFHPTVKPTQLMRYLIKLVTPPGGTVLDPFTGSGSTGKAALLDGYQFVGAELTEEYLPIIEGRLRWASEQVEETDDTLF